MKAEASARLRMWVVREAEAGSQSAQAVEQP
jgi:hypothetical protein